MDIYYIKKESGICIDRCRGWNPDIRLPGRIEDQPVTAIGSYAFSQWKRQETENTEVWHDDNDILPRQDKSKLLCGDMVRSLEIPKTLTAIGDYAFYGCSRLEKLTLTDRVRDLGGGVFTGCKLKKIELYLFDGTRSCLKDILAEVRHKLVVTLSYHDKANKKTETAKLIFPEFYEEAVENTPARILETHYHGSGCHYRQCFFDRQIDYLKYDQLFPMAQAWESPEIIIDIAAARLRHPVGLAKDSREQYRSYLQEHCAEAAMLYIRRETIEPLFFLSDFSLWSRDSLDAAITYASSRQKPQFISYLMNEKQQRWPKSERQFLL